MELYAPWVCTKITYWVRPLVRSFAVRENVHSSCSHSIFRSHFACICHSLTTGMLSHFFMEEGLFKLANIQRWSCILLSVGFTLHEIIFFYVLNMLNVYISRWKNDHTPCWVQWGIRTQRTKKSFYFPILK